MNIFNMQEMNKYCNEISKFKVSCECGHKVFIPENKKYNICSWCGKKVYKNELEKFKCKLLNKIKEMKKNEYNNFNWQINKR